MKIKVIDLFCGAGGMSWSFSKSGFNIIAGLDNWEKALKTFQYNNPTSRIFLGDITKISALDVRTSLKLKREELDVLVGGPPCQGFSKNVPSTYRFLEDPRNQLFRDFLRFVKELLPKVVIMENVAEIYNAYNGSVRDEILMNFEMLGYKVNVKVLFAPEYGIPQRRRRAFFFASRLEKPPTFPNPTNSEDESNGLFYKTKRFITAWEAISDLPVLEDGEGYEPMEYTMDPTNEYQEHMRMNTDKLFDHIAKKLNPIQYERIASLKPGEGMKNLPENIKPRSGYSGAYGRLDFIMLAPTITRWVFHPGSGRYSHPREKRLITIREAARIQSFTDDFRFIGTYHDKAHQVGNAVPPLIIESFIKEIKRNF